MTRPTKKIQKQRAKIQLMNEKRAEIRHKKGLSFNRSTNAPRFRKVIELLKGLKQSVYMPNYSNMKADCGDKFPKYKFAPSIIYAKLTEAYHIKRSCEYVTGTRIHDRFERIFDDPRIISVFPQGICTNKYYWISGKPDAIIGSTSGQVLVELKTHSSIEFKYLKKTNFKLPIQIHCQVQTYMHMLEIEKCFVCFYCYETTQSHIKIVDIDPDFEEELQQTFKAFIINVFNRKGFPNVRIPPQYFQQHPPSAVTNRLKEFTGDFPFDDIKKMLKERLKLLGTERYDQDPEGPLFKRQAKEIKKGLRKIQERKEQKKEEKKITRQKRYLRNK